ncbi:Uncharacterised protein [uncultured archaeon]|nr:Uncharacterised protein [uncultured archaeon]
MPKLRKPVKVSIKDLKWMQSHYSHHARKDAAKLAGRMRDPKSLTMLRSSLFDSHSSVRLFASRSLSRRIGLRATADFILKRYPRGFLSRVPREFFLSWGTHYTIASKRLRGADSSLAEARELEKRYGKPIFYHRGFPVYRERVERRDDNALNRSGVIVIQDGGNKNLRRFDHAAAEHEYGENWSHQVGLALELRWLKNSGLLKNYIKTEPYMAERFLEILKMDPNGFKEYAPYFKGLVKEPERF